MEQEDQRWEDINNIILRKSPYQPNLDGFTEEQWKQNLFTKPILVIGAGGLGCEILKNLALSGFTDIHVVDMDTIDLTNLNRQFLFRNKDVGQGKAEVAAKFVMERVQGVKVTPYNKSIQQLHEELGNEFYQGFQIVVAGLDNVKARQWLNQQLHQQTAFDENGNVDPAYQYYMIDGGTEGLSGQARVIRPYISNCYECSLASMGKQETVNLCTIASVPRTPQHCVLWAMLLDKPGTWAHAHPDRKWDTDCFDDMNELYKLSLARANEYNISGVTYELACGVVKNIIPAVASTNAIIAAVCCNEAIKIASRCSQVLNNRFSSNGHENMSGDTQIEQISPNCIVCMKPQVLKFSRQKSVQELKDYFISEYQATDPSITSDYGDLIAKLKVQRDDSLLGRKFQDIIDEESWYENTVISVYDSSISPKLDKKFILTFIE